eukprot:s3125_g5.t1
MPGRCPPVSTAGFAMGSTAQARALHLSQTSERHGKNGLGLSKHWWIFGVTLVVLAQPSVSESCRSYQFPQRML